MFDFINIPLGYLMKIMYNLTHSYAFALLLFAIVVKAALLPLNIKQQKSQVKMAKIRPKENAIRKKYAGRSDTATQQKMQAEVMDLYKAEGHSPMAGCLPLLIQFPILIALYNIVRNPLTYILGMTKDSLTQIKDTVFALYKSGGLADFTDFFKTITETTTKNINEIHLIKVMDVPANLDKLKETLPFLDGFKNIDLKMFGGVSLADSPAQYGLSLLLLIPLLNFAVTFMQSRLTKKMNAGTTMGEMQGQGAMKIMEYTLPLLTVYMTYTYSAALGLYWFYTGAIQIVQTLLLAKYYPMPKITDDEVRLAEEQYGVKKKKKKKDDDGNLIEAETVPEDDAVLPEGKPAKETEETETDDKYISDTLTKGINPNIKGNYAKTGKKYNVKKKK